MINVIHTYEYVTTCRVALPQLSVGLHLLLGFGFGLRRARHRGRLYACANSDGYEARGKELPPAAAHAPRYLESAHGMLLAHLALRG